MSDADILSDRVRHDDPPVSLGTLLAIGAASRAGTQESLSQALGDLDDLAIPVPAAPDITIQNMVFTADLATSLNVPTVVVALGLDRTEYEPEQHPALIYRPDDPAVVLLVFSSGKLVITGTTKPAPATTALTALASELNTSDGNIAFG
jgi:transcription initiation factor TFIID TATA-box-binding protein